MFDRFIMTKHFIEMYSERCEVKVSDVRKRVRYDLSVKQIRRIVNIGDHRHVFTRNAKEFIFRYDHAKKVWIAKTIIKRSRFTADDVIERRLREQAEFRAKEELDAATK